MSRIEVDGAQADGVQIFKQGETTEGLMDCVNSYYGAVARAFPAKTPDENFATKKLPGLDFNEAGWNALCILNFNGKFSSEEVAELNAIFETEMVDLNDLVEIYGSIKVQALMELRRRKRNGNVPRMEHIFGKYRQMLDLVYKPGDLLVQAMPARVKACFLRCRQLAVRHPALFQSLFARVYREVEIFDQMSETSGRAEAAVVRGGRECLGCFCRSGVSFEGKGNFRFSPMRFFAIFFV